MKRKNLFSLILIFVLLFLMLLPLDVSAEEDPDLYWIKVNRQENVVTVYRNQGGEYVPYRAMICSAGGEGHETPLMTSGIDQKFRWLYLIGDVWGQYCTQIQGDYLFHSVYYEKKGRKDTLVTEEYNKLGTGCSKGCIRLSVINAKWIYDNCCKDTKVTIYDSDVPGPLGKPAAQRLEPDVKWDPTDPDENNPVFFIQRPIMKIDEDKKQELAYGSKYNLLEGVSAVDPNTYQDLTDSVEVSEVKIWDGETWKKTKFSTEKVGKYNVTYKVYDEYCGDPAYETLSIKVFDYDAPVIKAADYLQVRPGSKGLLNGVTARQKSRDRIGAIEIIVLEPDGDKYKFNYAKAKEYIFEEHGDYFVTYSVNNYYDPSSKDTEITVIRCMDEFEENTSKWPGIKQNIK